MEMLGTCLLSIYFFAVILVLHLINSSDLVQFRIEYVNRNLSKSDLVSFIPMLTTEKQVFHCSLPKVVKERKYPTEQLYSTRLSELDLLKKSFSHYPCSYKIDKYWTYELCHLKHLRQYHNEATDSTTSKSEHSLSFILGFFVDSYEELVEMNLSHLKKTSNSSRMHVPRINLKGEKLPYFAIHYKEGMFCDITGLERETTVFYTCKLNSHGEIADLHEVESCRYQVIVYVHELCAHQHYIESKMVVNLIQCFFVLSENVGVSKEDGLLLRPQKLQEIQSSVLKKQVDKDAMKIRLDNKLHNLELDKTSETSEALPSLSLKRFIEGTSCINGGRGWWKYEYCFQHIARQFHIELGSITNSIILGMWDADKHMKYIQHHPELRPHADKRSRKMLGYYLGMGDICPDTGNPRTTLIMLICVHRDNDSITNTISEPVVCSYQMEFRSNIFCWLMENTDEYGMLLKTSLSNLF